jgi:serine protease
MAQTKRSSNSTSSRSEIWHGQDIVIKLGDNANALDRGHLSPADWLKKTGLGDIGNLKSKGALALEPLFDMSQLESVIEQAQERDGTYRPPRLQNYLVLSHGPEEVQSELIEQIRHWNEVETVYPTLEVAPPPGLPPKQAYLRSAPVGVSFLSSAGPRLNAVGVNGDGISFGDLEEGWDFDHPLMPKRPGGGVDGGVDMARNPDHGRKSVGIVTALPTVPTPPTPVPTNTYLSLAPNALTRFYSAWVRLTPTGAPRYNVAKAIAEAIAGTYRLNYGDVLLLEVQGKFTGTNFYGPVEIAQDVYDIIRLATAYGVIVIEPAGTNPAPNAQNLDTYLTRANSGALIVGASDASNNWLDVSNYGSRVDFFARGSDLSVLGPHDSGETVLYVDVGTETGTSWSAAIVAGVAVSTQGMVRAASGSAAAYRLSPAMMRRLLATSGATLSNDSATRPIGVMPNLEAISTKFATVPDVYLRHDYGDTGCPGASTGIESPDITIRRSNNMVIDPNDTTHNYSESVWPDDTPYLYARVTNRAPAGSTNAALTGITVTFYRALSSTLSTPDSWVQVGSPAYLPWLDPSMSAVLPVNTQMHFTSSWIIVAVASANEDPAPALTGLTNVDCAVLLKNNNIARRTLLVNASTAAVASPSARKLAPPNKRRKTAILPSQPLFVQLAGADRGDSVMDIEVRTSLPPGSRLQLEAPASVMRRLLGGKPPFVEIERITDEKMQLLSVDSSDELWLASLRGESEIWRIPLLAQVTNRYECVALPEKYRGGLRIHVKLPDAAPPNPRLVTILQLNGNEEAGRLTFDLAQCDAKGAEGSVARQKSAGFAQDGDKPTVQEVEPLPPRQDGKR